MKLYLLLAALGLFSIQALAENDCTIAVSTRNPKSNQTQYLKKILIKKGYVIKEKSENPSFLIGAGMIQICTDGRETFWDEMFHTFDIADVAIYRLPGYATAYRAEREANGFLPAAIAKKFIRIRRLVRNLPTCENGVLSKTGTDFGDEGEDEKDSE